MSFTPAGAGCANKTYLTRCNWYLSTKPAPTPRWCGYAAVRRAAPRQRGVWSLDNSHLRGHPATTWDDCAVYDRERHELIFLAYVRQCLVPALKRDEIVLMDNLPVHKVAGVVEATETASAMFNADGKPVEPSRETIDAALDRSCRVTLQRGRRLLRRGPRHLRCLFLPRTHTADSGRHYCLGGRCSGTRPGRSARDGQRLRGGAALLLAEAIDAPYPPLVLASHQLRMGFVK